MAGYAFGFARFRHQKELRQNGHRFQVNGERPQHLEHSEIMVDQQGKDDAGYEQKFDAERIMITIVSGPKFDKHQIDGAQRCGNEERFHKGIVHGNECGEQIQISRQIGDGKEDL